MLTRATALDLDRQSRFAYATAGEPPSKRRILRAALHLFARKGLHAVTVRDIAREAGYSNPALFKFFATKDLLALHLFEHCYTNMFAELSLAAEADEVFLLRLRAIIGTFTSQIEHDADAVLFVQDHLRELWPRVSRQVRKRSIVGLIRATLQQGIREGSVSAAISIDLLVAALTGTLAQFARMYYFNEFPKPAHDWSPDLERVIMRIVAP